MRGYHERFRRVEFRPVRYDVDELVDRLAYAECDVIVASATIGTGHALYPSQVFPHHPDMDPDYFPKLVEACHARDIAVCSWVVFNIQDVFDPDDYAPAKKWPQWRLQTLPDENGEVSNGTGMCLLGSPYKQVLGEFLLEIVALGVDAIWFDGYAQVTVPGRTNPGCVCEFCAEAFREATGLALPEAIDWSSERFRAWVDWRYDALAETTEYLAGRVHEAKPGLPIVLNAGTSPWSGPGWRLDWRYGCPVRHWPGLSASHHGGTGEFNGPNLVPLQAKFAAAQSGEPGDVWTSCWTHKELRFAPPREFMLKMHAFACLTEGVAPWFGMAHGSDRSLAEESPRHRWTPLKHANAAIALRESHFGGEPVPYIAVGVSRRTRDFDATARGSGSAAASLHGVHSALAEKYLLHHLVFVDDLDGDEGAAALAHHPMLLLSNQSCLSDAAVAAIDGYVRDGGVLVATFETSRLGPRGEARDDFALADLLGVHWRETVAGRDPRRGLLAPAELTGGPEPISIGAPHCLIDVETDVDVLVRSEDDAPAVTRRAVGAGQVLYFAEDVGAGYHARPYRWTRELLGRLLTDLRRPPVEVEGPTVLYTNAFVAGDELRVHLLNLPFASNRLAYRHAEPTLEEVVPIHDIVVRTTLGPFTDAEAVVIRQRLDAVRVNDSTQLRLPRLQEHEIVVLRG